MGGGGGGGGGRDYDNPMQDKRGGFDGSISNMGPMSSMGGSMQMVRHSNSFIFSRMVFIANCLFLCM